MTSNKCFFCDTPTTLIKDNTIECKICGKYFISSYLRENFENGIIINLKDFNLLQMIDFIKKPKNPIESIDKIILFINKKVKTPSEYYPFDLKNDYSIAYARNEQEFKYYLLSSLKPDINFLESNQNNGYRLTLNGWKRLEVIQNRITDSRKAFVAMWFDDKMLDIFKDYISKSISDCGYEPFTILMKEHNDNICDQIIAEIRKSKFIIADFTGHRGGVYFEAGFAFGLGIPVIWTCREDWFNHKLIEDVQVKYNDKNIIAKKETERLIHFDISHYNFIKWKNGDDLYNQLKKRIDATIL
jgi:nucleoside 2-deoxyribosyltransferase